MFDSMQEFIDAVLDFYEFFSTDIGDINDIDLENLYQESLNDSELNQINDTNEYLDALFKKYLEN